MHNWTMAILPLVLSIGVAGCNGSVSTGDGKGETNRRDAGPQATQSYALTGFTAVRATGPDDVTIRQGEAFSITAKGPKAVIDELEITLDGDVLSIGRKTSGFSFSGGKDDVDIAITMPRLRALRLTGSGEIDADAVDGDAVEAVVTGSGDLKVAKMNGKSAKISISGSGDVDVGSGTIGTGEYSVTGSGGIDADGLTATGLSISIAGSGDVEARATGTADVNILGSGDATIDGGAKCTTRTMGSGTATCR